MKRLISLTFCLMTTLLSFAHDFQVSGIYYNLNSQYSRTVEVTYEGDSYSSNYKYTSYVSIPPFVTYGSRTYSVTKIGNNAFYDCSGLTSVSIPNSVTSIGLWSFYGCSSLTSVTIPNRVTSIGEYAFYKCSGLTSVTIPSSVTSISSYAFDGCSSLTSVYVGKETPISIGSGVFSNRANATLYVPAGSKSAYSSADYWKEFKAIVEMNYFVVDGICYHVISSSDRTVEVTNKESASGTTHEYTGSFTIPSFVTFGGRTYSVTKIGELAFYNCKNLVSVTIPSGVTSIGRCAFQDCRNLTSITIPNSVESIDNLAFLNCSSLTSVIIPVTSIGQGAFYGCSGLTSVTIPFSVTSIGASAFRDCSSLTSVTIPNSMTSIEEHTFDGCSRLSSVIFLGNVTSIGNYAFYGCSSLSSVTVEMETPISIDSDVFSNRKNATLHVPFGCQSAYSSADYWKEFKEIVEDNKFAVDGIYYKDCSTTPNTVEVTYKGESYSSYADEYTGTVKIPSSVTYGGKTYSVTSIADEAFSGCMNLTSITIPSSVTKIGNNAFYDCSGLTSVSIPNSVTSIGKFAFYRCNGLTSVDIPFSVTSIGASAFRDCSDLTEVFIPSSVKSIGDNAFKLCGSLIAVNVYIEQPLSITNNVFSNRANATLYVPKGSKSAYEAADYWKEFKKIVEIDIPYVVGDINGDNVVDILDYTGIANYIHGNAPEGFNEQAADVDNNGVIDILDYTGIANIIHTGSIYGNTNNARATGN